jgi:hypothetical protein
MFLFVLFFEPFPLDKFDFNNSMVFVAGIAAISFAIMSLVRITLPWMIKKYDQHQFDPLLPPYANSFLIFTLHLLSFGFYIRYVGSVSMSIPIVFKLALLSLFPPISLWLHDLIKDLKKQREALKNELEVFKGKLDQYVEDSYSQPIEFISESSSENFKLLTSDVVLVKSADNYVEIVFNEGDGLKSKLIRSTLKNVELQLKMNANFIRCHRTCIINVSYVEKLGKDMSNHWLSIKGYNDRIPVSRQYLLKIKEAI